MLNDRFILCETIVSYYVKRPFHIISNERFALLKQIELIMD